MREVRIQHPISAQTRMWGKEPVTMLAIKRSAGVIPEVNLREHTSCMPLASVNKVAHSSFETQRCQQKYNWSHKRTCVHPKKFFFKKCSEYSLRSQWQNDHAIHYTFKHSVKGDRVNNEQYG